MALQYVGGKAVGFQGTLSDTAISLTDLTGGLASSPSADDIVIVAYCVGSTGDTAIGVTTTGYAEEQELFSDDGADTNLSVSWKVMGATPDTSVSVSQTGSVDNAGAVAIHVWRGGDTSTPFDVAETTATGIDTGQPNPPSITPTTAGSVAIGIGGAGAGTAGSGVFTSSDLSNFVTHYEDDARDAIIGMGSIAWTSGAINPAQFGGGSTAGSSSWAAVTLVLKPAPTNVDYEFNFAAGSYSITGTSSTFVYGRTLAFGVGSYAITGTTPTYQAALSMAFGEGSYTITGVAPDFTLGRVMAFGVGAYEIVGEDFSLEADLRVFTYEGTAPERVITLRGISRSYVIPGRPQRIAYPAAQNRIITLPPIKRGTTA